MKALIIASIKGMSWAGEFAGFEQRIYSQGALGTNNIPADPKRPYMQIGMGEAPAYAEVRRSTTSLAHAARLYVYDDMGSFTRINEIHRRVRETLEGLGGTVSPSGRRCTDCVFFTLGGEDTIPELKASVRVATYRITGPQ